MLAVAAVLTTLSPLTAASAPVRPRPGNSLVHAGFRTPPVSSWRSCPSDYWGGGSFLVRVYRLSCHQASDVTGSGFRRGTRNTNVGGFHCRRIAPIMPFRPSYECLRHAGHQGLSFATF